MDILITALVCYLGLGALTCASPRQVSPDGYEHTPLGQWEVFRTTFADVLGWPWTLWREFGWR